MANSDKDIKITPNTGESASPKIEVTGADNATKTITINDDGTISFDSTIAATSGSVANGNANLVTGDAVFDYIALQGYTTNTGDITAVVAGNGLTGGATSGSATVTVGAGTGITVNSGDVAVTAAQTGITSVLNSSLKLGYGASDAYIDFGTDNQIDFSIDNAAQLILSDGTFRPAGSNDIALGDDAKRWSSVSTIGLSIGGTNSSAATMTAILDEDDMSSDSATALATQQSIKAYVDANAGSTSPAGSDTFIQYNNGGSFGATTLAFDDTAGSEQILLDDTSDVALMKVVQRGTGSSFEVHDQASDSTVFQVSASGATSIGLGAGSGTGSDILFVQGRSSGQIWTASTDGSASAPVFTRRTDLNTGMYFIGADNIGLTTGGTLRVDISDSGLKLGSSGSRVTTILDEDDMSTDSDTALATQQSIKAYVDNNAGGASLANDANNRVVTATGSGGINGEANLTFDGSTLALTGVQTITAADTVNEAFRVDITDSDGTADSTPFVVDGNGRVGIGTASPLSDMALTLNGDGTSYEGLAFQVGGSTKFKMSSDGSAMYFDSQVNTYNFNFRTRNSSGALRPTLGLEGDGFRTAIGYNGTSGSSLTPNNTLQVNVGTEDGVQDKDDGILLLNSDTSIADGDMIGGIGFATRDGNIPSVTTEAAAAIVAYAAEAHGTGDKGGDLTFLTSAINDDDDTASNERMRITSEGFVGIGTTSPDAMLHVNSGTDLDCGIIIEADTDNNDEADLPFLWFKQDGDITVHAIQGTSNRFQIINNISASGGIDFLTGTTNNTGTTNPATNATAALSIESDGGVQARKTVIKAVSSNTTLADEDSGKTIYWTGGTLTLPATAQSGQQFVVINNTNASATPSLGTSNAIATNWTAHAAMDDETARTYIAVAANTWIYIG
tara:strand:+ start:2223 stop:4931 length:2709 start_codon:yes stop_codon:yes gene_type:complete